MTQTSTPRVPPTSPVRLTVADVMIHEPKTLDAHATVEDLRRFFQDDHVHMALLVESGRLLGTVTRADLQASWPHGASALGLSRLVDRTISAETPAETSLETMAERGQRRLAVTDAEGRVRGLLCLKRRLTGFCSDKNLAERARATPSKPTPPLQTYVTDDESGTQGPETSGR